MHIEFLVEEESAEAFLRGFVPRAFPDCAFRVHTFQGKRDLLRNLPMRLRAYRKWIEPHWRIVVLVDEDRQDCRALKGRLEKAANDAGLTTRSSAKDPRFVVLNRIAIEELEAWFFGDVDALARAYPRIPRTLASKSPFRDPDAILGGTWEALERVLKKAGYYRTGLPKVEVARRLAPVLDIDPARSRSRSFRHFVIGLEALRRS